LAKRPKVAHEKPPALIVHFREIVVEEYLPRGQRSAAKLLTNEARMIAANIAKLPGLLR
jgi:hypothetical protein